jgi:hypothetical protein
VVVNNTLTNYKGHESSIVVPQNIKYIRSNTFDSNAERYSDLDSSFISEIYFSDSVQEIDIYQFYGNIDIITLYIPSSVIKIGDGLDGEVICLFDRYFMEGTENEHLKIVTTAGSYAEEYAKKFDIPYEIVDSWEVPET